MGKLVQLLLERSMVPLEDLALAQSVLVVTGFVFGNDQNFFVSEAEFFLEEINEQFGSATASDFGNFV